MAQPEECATCPLWGKDALCVFQVKGMRYIACNVASTLKTEAVPKIDSKIDSAIAIHPRLWDILRFNH